MIWFAAIAVLIVAITVWYVARPLARPAMPDSSEHRDQLQQLRERLLVQLSELDIEEGDRNIDADVVSDERRRLGCGPARWRRRHGARVLPAVPCLRSGVPLARAIWTGDGRGPRRVDGGTVPLPTAPPGGRAMDRPPRRGAGSGDPARLLWSPR